MHPSKIASLFICYSFDQIDWTREIGSKINTIYDGKINAWWDERKSTGDYWDNIINQKLSEADVFLLILSPGFFKSDYIQNTELPIIIRRHESEKIRVIPIIASKINFEQFKESWLNEIDVFPHRGLQTINQLQPDEIDNWIRNLSIEPVWRRMEMEFRRISIRTLSRPFQYDLQLPDGSGYIIERNEIEELENWNVRENDQKIAFLIGEAGSGKSSILYQYASRNVETGRILYIDVREYSNTKNYSDFIQVLEISYEEENFFKQIEKLDSLTICIDSLDVVCWNPKTFNFFLQLIYRLYSFSNIRFVLACRIFDLKNNGDLLILKDQSKVFHLEKLPREITESILLKAGFLFTNKKDEKNEILEFFSLPLYLKMLLMLNVSESSSLLDLSKETALYERIWNDKVNGKNKHIDERSSPQERAILCYRLSEQSLNRRQLDIPLSILKNSGGYTVDADEVLKSEGFIQGEFARGFFHQTVLDHVTVCRVRENGEDPYKFVKSYLNDFFSQPILRVYLSYLHLEINPRIRKEYIQSIEKILIDKGISRIWKLNAIRFLAELSTPVQDEIDLLDKLLIPDSIFEIYFIQYFHPNWLPILLNLKYTDRLPLSKNGMAHFRLLKALTKLAESNKELNYFVLFAKELFKHFQLNSARDIHQFLLRLKREDRISLFPQYVNYLIHPEAVKDKSVRFLSKDHWELFQSVLIIFPDLVLNSILNAEFNFISYENNFEVLIQGILQAHPNLIKSILTHFVNLLVKRKKIHYNFINSEEENTRDSSFEGRMRENNLELTYESDIVCVYYYDQNTFYPEITDQNHYWANAIETSCIFHARKGSLEYPVLYRKLLSTPFETPVRIALLSALEYKNEKLYLDFYLNPNYFKLSSIGPMLIQNLSYIRDRLSDAEWSSIENSIHLVAAYRLTQYGKDSASNFYIEVRTSLRESSVSQKMKRKFIWAEAIYKKRIDNWNKENIHDQVLIPEFIELEARPDGISDVVMAGAAFSEEDYLTKPLQERLQLLIDHGPGSKSDRSLGSWWVGCGFVIEDIYLKNPLFMQEDLISIAERTELLPYRCFLIRAITTYTQKKLVTPSTPDESSKNEAVMGDQAIENISKNVLLLTERDRSDLGRDYATPISDFLDFICVSYKIFSPKIRRLIRNKFHAHLPNIVEIEAHLKSIKDEDRGWSALNTSVNTQIGKAIEAASIILYYEKEAPIELDLIVRMSKSKEISNRVGVAARLIYLKNEHREVAEQILNDWDQAKDLVALQFGIRYFQRGYPSEIPSILDYLSKWIQYVENEIVNDDNRKRLPHYSLSAESVKLLLHFASSEERARELLEYIFNQNVPDTYLLRITAIYYIFDHCLDPLTEYYSQLLERMSIDPVPAVRESLIPSIWQSKDHLQKSERNKIHNYPELARKIFLNAIKRGNLSDDFLPHLISEHVSQTWKASPEWAVEIFELIILENKVVFYEHDLSNFAQTIKSIYLFEKELQNRCSELLNYCIDKGWDGLDDLFGLGRG